MIAIVDYGMGNLGSVRNMLRRVDAPAIITSDPAELRAASKILLPGVGRFAAAMERIDAMGLRETLDELALDERVPVLGICLGMQLLARHSEEGDVKGLGWIDADVRRFPDAPGLKVPHMGWNSVTSAKKSRLTDELPADARFYFVHSYYVQVDHQEDSVLKAEHGVRFDAAIEKGNVFGAQFHPEKSHKFGRQVLQNFARL